MAERAALDHPHMHAVHAGPRQFRAGKYVKYQRLSFLPSYVGV